MCSRCRTQSRKTFIQINFKFKKEIVNRPLPLLNVNSNYLNDTGKVLKRLDQKTLSKCEM